MTCLLLCVAGCGGPWGSPQDPDRPTLGLSAIDEEGTFLEDGQNGGFGEPRGVNLDQGPRAIRGSIGAPADVDLYDLGPVSAGDHILVTMATDGLLDGAIGLFDNAGTALLINDHRNVYLGRKEPFVDVVIRRDAPSCVIAAAATPGYDFSGDYTLLASKDVGRQMPVPRPDVVLLVFHGSSNVRIGSRPAIHVPPFDASDISPAFSGMTDRLMDEVVARTREDLAGYQVTVLSTHEGATDNGTATRIYFGAFDEALLGVAEGIDEFNATPAQSAIVFTDTFEVFLPIQPSLPEMAQAIANVASHEIGHLLGLVHTADPHDIMDVTASLTELVQDQRFAKAPIHADTFPYGYQDSVQSLLDNVGGDIALILAQKTRAATRKVLIGGPVARGVAPLSSCQIQEHLP